MIEIIVALVVGLVLGGFGMYLYCGKQSAALSAAGMAAEARIEGLQSQIHTAELVKAQMEQSFKALSTEVLNHTIELLTSQAGEKLGAVGDRVIENIGQTKDAIGKNLGQVSSGLESLLSKTSALDEGLRTGAEISQRLADTTQGLKQVLSSSQARGRWGERMVEDILSVLGLVEGINYEAQKAIGTGERPDFIFKLPDEKTINMDVKFPIDKYEEYIQAEDAGVRAAAEKSFLGAVRGHVKTLAGRGYIDPAGGTVDYLLMFIPNEAIYSFIHKHDPDLLDYSLEQGIVLCSPITLYAILSLIRQSIKSFAMTAQTGEIMNLLSEFGKQWENYVDMQDKMGESLAQAQKRYEAMVTARTKKLTSVVSKVNDLERPQLSAGLPDPPLQMEG